MLSMKKIDKILFIDSPAFVRFLRAKKRDRMKSLQIIERFFSQRFLFSQYKKTGIEIFRIINCGNLSLLKKKIERAVFKR